MGNGLIDLAYLLLYGVRIEEFSKSEVITDSLVLYYECLLRHGVTHIPFEQVERKFKEAIPYSFLRYIWDELMKEPED